MLCEQVASCGNASQVKEVSGIRYQYVSPHWMDHMWLPGNVTEGEAHMAAEAVYCVLALAGRAASTAAVLLAFTTAVPCGVLAFASAWSCSACTSGHAMQRLSGIQFGGLGAVTRR